MIKPPWEAEEEQQDRAAASGVVECKLSAVVPGSTLAKNLYSGAGHVLLHKGQLLDKRTLERLTNLSELDDSVGRLFVTESREPA